MKQRLQNFPSFKHGNLAFKSFPDNELLLNLSNKIEILNKIFKIFSISNKIKILNKIFKIFSIFQTISGQGVVLACGRILLS
jgi:hypothetical protein